MFWREKVGFGKWAAGILIMLCMLLLSGAVMAGAEDTPLDVSISVYHEAPQSKCSACHVDNLALEHARTTTEGVEINCESCHSSENQIVQQAVMNKQKDCSACHLGQPDNIAVDMPNNLSNAGCVTCHTGYPSDSTKGIYHKGDNCGPCHGGGFYGPPSPPYGDMWNCTYCHVTKFTDTIDVWTDTGWVPWNGTVSGFKYYLGPLRGYSLENKLGWMGAHFAGPVWGYTPPKSFAVDSNFKFHETNMHVKHNSEFPGNGCAECHKGTLTAEHFGRAKVISDPAENFDGNPIFNFTGDWGGTGYPSEGTGYSGSSYTFGERPATQTTVNVDVYATVSFRYKIIPPYWLTPRHTTRPLLTFYIDDNKVFEGLETDSPWNKVSFGLNRGSHTLKWTGRFGAHIDDLTVTGGSTSYNTDCNTCHLSANPLVKSAIKNHLTNCLVCHPTAGHGQVQHDAVSTGGQCQGCHASDLAGDHVKRKDKLDNPVDCATCHQSQNQAVQDAIAGRNNDCAACHTVPDHKPVHNDPVFVEKGFKYCMTCHQAELSEEHMNNSTTTTGYGFDCDTCHSNSSSGIKRTIAAKSKNCGGCHKKGHNINFVETVPADIPLFAGYQWTTPMEASIFAGESSPPAGYEDGVLVQSNRRDVLLGDIRSFYLSQMTGDGWTIKSQASNGDSSFSAEFAKADRLVTVKCYNTEVRDGVGNRVTAGYRIEIWYIY